MKIPSKKSLTVAGVFLAVLIGVVACNGPRPLAPSQNVSLGVSVAPSQEVKASLLGTTSNTLLWNVRGTAQSGLHGQVGPFSSSSATGNVNFSVDIPAGGTRVISVQLNDANTNQPLAVGAIKVDMSNPTANMAVTLVLGSVQRQCYVLNNAATFSNSYDLYKHVDSYYSLSDLTVLTGNYPNFELVDWNLAYLYYGSGYSGNINNTVAYLGNGNLSDYDYVPSDDQFFSDSESSKNNVLNPSSSKPTPIVTQSRIRRTSKLMTGPNLDLEAGDIYCIKLYSLPGAYAWVQVTDPGDYNNSVGPSFRFRISTDPFFSYYQTYADQTQTCSTWVNNGS